MTLKIKYYLNFTEDQRVSMDDYAERLINSDKNNHQSFSIDFYRPEISLLSKLILKDNWKMRYARYISYPYQVKKISNHSTKKISLFE